jgi:hypothetical protein
VRCGLFSFSFFWGQFGSFGGGIFGLVWFWVWFRLLLLGFGRFVFLWMGFSFEMLFPPSSPTDGLLLLVGGGMMDVSCVRAEPFSYPVELVIERSFLSERRKEPVQVYM